MNMIVEPSGLLDWSQRKIPGGQLYQTLFSHVS